MIKLGNKSIKGIYIKIGTEIKQLFLKEKKDNKLIDYILYNINKDIEYEFNQANRMYRTNTFTVDGLIDVESITVDNGTVEYKIDGNKLTVIVDNGKGILDYNPCKNFKEGIKNFKTSNTNNFSMSMEYTEGDYSGTLYAKGNSYVSSGSYTPSASKQVTDYRTSSSDSFNSSMSYNSSGYSGTLSKNDSSYVYTGAYTPTNSKEMTKFIPLTGYAHLTWSNGSWTYYIEYSSQKTYNYSDNEGYSGTLKYFVLGDQKNAWGIWAYYNPKQYLEEWMKTNKGSYEGEKRTLSGGHDGEFNGTVTRPASDTRRWRQDYSGTVYRPSSDTRVWRQDYEGIIYKGGNDTYYKYKVKIKCKVKK